jgi:hypothetical protein
MRKLNRQEFLEMRRRMHEEWLRRDYRFQTFSIVIEDGEAVVRGWGGDLEVRFPANGLLQPDALRRRGF